MRQAGDRHGDAVISAARGWHPYGIIVFLGLAVYLQTLTFGLTYLDDDVLLGAGRRGGVLSGAVDAFGQTVFGRSAVPYYRPLLMLSFAIDGLVGGASPAGAHAVNIILHCIVSCLVFVLFLVLGYRRESALFLSALFVVHPALAQAVAWIPGRNDLLLALFAIPSFIFFDRYLVGRRRVDALYAILFFALALFTKESALVLLPLYFVWAGALRPAAVRPGLIAGIAGGSGVVLIFWYLMRSAALAGRALEPTMTALAGSVARSLPAFLLFLGKTVLPFNLSVFPTLGDSTLIYGGIVLVAVVGAIALSKKRRMGAVLFGALLFTLIIGVSFIRRSPEFVVDFQEHRLYLPIIGILIVLLETDMMKASPLRRPAIILGTCLVLFFASLAFGQSRSFRSPAAFWDNAVRTAPTTPFVHLRRGLVYHRSGELDRAEASYREALRLAPASPAIYARLGQVALDRGAYAAAIDAFRHELERAPSSDSAYTGLGVALYKAGQQREAVAAWRQALLLNYRSGEAAKNLAVFYLGAGDGVRARFYTRLAALAGMPVPDEFRRLLTPEAHP